MATIEDFTPSERDLLAEAGAYRKSNPNGNRLLNLVAKLADKLGLSVTQQDVEPREIQEVGDIPQSLDEKPTEEQVKLAMGNTKRVTVEKDKWGNDKPVKPE